MGLGREWILYRDWNRSRAHAGNVDWLSHGAAARLSQLCDCLRRDHKNWSDTPACCREQRLTNSDPLFRSDSGLDQRLSAPRFVLVWEQVGEASASHYLCFYDVSFRASR